MATNPSDTLTTKIESLGPDGLDSFFNKTAPQRPAGNDGLGRFFKDPVEQPIYQPTQVDPISVADFTAKVMPQAERVASKLGVSVDSVIGQWGLETGWGKSVIPGTNNLGNIKDFSGGGVAATDNATGSRDKYKAFPSLDSFADSHADLLSRKYTGAVGSGNDAEKFFTGLKAGGYAEDPNYVQKGTAAAALVAKARQGMQSTQQEKPLAIDSAPKWSAIVAKPEYKSMSAEDRAGVREAYFNRHIAPDLPDDQLETYRSRFYGNADQIEPKELTLLDRAKETVKKLYTGGTTQPDNPDAIYDPVTGVDLSGSSVPVKKDESLGVMSGYQGKGTPDPKFDASVVGFAQASKNKLDHERETARLKQVAASTGGVGLASSEGKKFTPLDEEAFYKYNNDPLYSNTAVRSAVKVWEGFKQGAYGVNQAVWDLVGADEYAKQQGAKGDQSRAKILSMGEPENYGMKMLEGAVTSIAQQLPAMVVGIATGTEGLALGSMFVNSFGQEYGQGKMSGLNARDAAQRGALFASFEVLGEKAGLKFNMDKMRQATQGMSPDILKGWLANTLTKELPGEFLTTTGQFLTDKTSYGLNKEAGMAEYLQQMADTAVQTILQSGLMAGGTKAIAKGVEKFAGNGQSITAPIQQQTEAPEQQSPATPNIATEPAPVAEATPITTPVAEAVPTAAPVVRKDLTADDQYVLDYAESRREMLIDKREGTVVDQPSEDGTKMVSIDRAGKGLSKAEQAELQAIEQAGGDVTKLNELYGITKETPANVPEPAKVEQEAQTAQGQEVKTQEQAAAAAAEPIATNAAEPATIKESLTVDQAPAAVETAAPLTQEANQEKMSRLMELARVEKNIDKPSERNKAFQRGMNDAVEGMEPQRASSAYIEGHNYAVEKLKAESQPTETVKNEPQAIETKQAETQGQEQQTVAEPVVAAKPKTEKEAIALHKEKKLNRDSIETQATIDEILKLEELNGAANEAATSPTNDTPQPTDAQKEAGNYKKGHVKLHGLDISIENPVGSTRNGKDKDGKAWETTMQHHYGYIKGTVGMDKDHIDTFIGTNHESDKVFVVDQIDPRTGKPDEHKVMLGFDTKEEAQAAYASNYAKDWKGGKTVTETTVQGFRDWVANGNTKAPFAKPKTEKEAKLRKASKEEHELVAKTLRKTRTREPVQEQTQTLTPEAVGGNQPQGDSSVALVDKPKTEKQAKARKEQQAATGVPEATAGSAQPVPVVKPKNEKEAKQSKAKQAAARLKESLGADVGDTITFSEKIGYLSANKPMEIESIGAKGEVYFRDPKSGSGTSEKLSIIEAYKKQGRLDWTITSKQKGADKESAGVNPTVRQETTVPEANKPATPIADFGEKIGGAKKDVWSGFKDKMDAAKELDIAAEPLSKSWPEPNYQALLDDGADPWAVGFMHAARDAVPRKPTKSYKLKSWATGVETLRGFAAEIADGTISAEKVKTEMRKLAGSHSPFHFDDLLNRIELYQAVGHSKSLADVRISYGEYAMLNGVEYKPSKIIWTVEKKAAATAFSNFPQQLAQGTTKQAAIDDFKAKFSTMEITKPASKEVTFDVFSERGKPGFYVGKKVGRNFITLAGPFDTVKEARAHRNDNQDQLVTQLEKAKEIPSERRDTNNPRVGEDMREGKDVTPEMFSNAFGFRGVEFGNYVEQGKRQSDLNEAYDALMDMAALLGIPPKSISLNGTLGLAFGARGSGGKQAAAAHYESNKVVINLTKKSGAGSLGHEWWHALDNYFSRSTNKPGGFMTERLDVNLSAKGSNYLYRDEGVRKEMVDAFGAVMKAIRTTAIKARSSKLDGKRTKEYWTTDVEMSARAFESYLISKLQDNNASNDYLANIVDPNTWAAAEKIGFELDDSYPYPTAGEIPAIRAGFDHLFSTIESKETDQGTALFSREVTQRSKWGFDIDELQPLVREISATWKNAPKTNIVQTVDDLTFYAPDNARGAYYKGQVYLIAANIRNPVEVEAVMLHEAMGHAGLNGVFGKGLSKELLAINNRNSNVADAAKKWRRTNTDIQRGMSNMDYFLVSIEEALAEIAGTGRQITGVERLLAIIQKGLRAIGLHNLANWVEKSTNAEALLILASARKYIEEGSEVRVFGQELAQSYSRETTPAPEEILAMEAEEITLEPLSSSAEENNDQVFTGNREEIERDLSIFISSFQEGTTRHLSDSASVRKIKRYSESAANDLRGDESAERSAPSKIGSFSSYETTARVEQNFYGKDQLVIDVYGHEQIEAGLDDHPALRIELQQDGEFSIYALPSSSQTYKEFVKRGWAEPATGKNKEVQFFAGEDGDFWTRLTGVKASEIFPLLGDIHARALAWTGKPKIILSWQRTTGASGGTDGHRAAVMFSRSQQNNWEAKPLTQIDKLIHDWQDKHVGLKRVQQAISETRDITEQFDAYQKEELYHGRVAARTAKFLDREVRPFIIDLKAKGITLDELEAYLWARHAPERNKQIASINMEMPDGGSGLTDAQARDYMEGKDVHDADGKVIIKGLKQADRGRIEALSERIDAINEGTKQALIQYGLESAETIQAWDAAYKHYVPLHREEMEGGGTPIGQGFSVKGDASKRAMGSRLKVTDILAHLALQREAAITRGEKNRVGLSLYGLALQNKNADFWETDKAPMVKRIDKGSGLVTKTVDSQYKNRPNAFIVRVGGEDRVILFNESNEAAMRTVESLKNLDMEQLGEVTAKFAIATRYIASINTQYNPVFGIVNGVRDVQAAVFNLSSTPLAGKQMKVIAAIPSAMRAIWKIERGGTAGNQYDDIYEDLKLSGGTTGYREIFRMGSDRAKALQKQFDSIDAGKAKALWDWFFGCLDSFNTSIENGTRLAVFKVAQDSNMSSDKSASIAKNITVNFNRKGVNSSKFNSYYAFFNAAIQGNARTLETLRGPIGKRIMLGGVTLGVIQALMASLMMDDDEWESIPEFTKQRNFIIPTGEKTYVMIPMALGLHVLPNIGRIVTEIGMRGGKNAGKSLMELLNVFAESGNPLGGASSLTQMIAPTIADPIAALEQNKDHMGREIFKEDRNPLQPTPGFKRARDSSSTASRAIAKGVNAASGGTEYSKGMVSPTPDQLDFIFGFLTGGVGRELNKFYTSIDLGLNKRENIPEYKKPIVGRFFGVTDEDVSISTKFWKNITEINALELEVKGRRKDGVSPAEFIQENPRAKLIGLANAYERQTAKIRSERHKIEFDEKMTEEVRTAKLKKQDEIILNVMRNFNKQVADKKFKP